MNLFQGGLPLQGLVLVKLPLPGKEIFYCDSGALEPFLSGKKKKLRTLMKTKLSQPILVSLGAHTLSVAALVVVSDGVDIWVALRFSYH